MRTSLNNIANTFLLREAPSTCIPHGGEAVLGDVEMFDRGDDSSVAAPLFGPPRGRGGDDEGGESDADDDVPFLMGIG